jgi:hypothetical protein
MHVPSWYIPQRDAIRPNPVHAPIIYGAVAYWHVNRATISDTRCPRTERFYKGHDIGQVHVQVRYFSNYCATTEALAISGPG